MNIIHTLHFPKFSSAGVGRTGTFIVLDQLLQKLEANALTLDVYGTVLKLRGCRPLIVQAEEQYVYLFDCLEEALNELRTSRQYMNQGKFFSHILR